VAGIEAQVAALAGPEGLDLPGWDPAAFERNLAGVRAAWREPIRRLLIFDNLEEPDLLRVWQPHEGGCRVLITSRHQTWAGRTGVWPLPLPPLERDASLVLLLAERERAGGPTREAVLADPAEWAAADAICAAVGDLPLALALAGAYLGTTPHTPLTHYHAALEKNVLEHPSMHAEWLDEALPGHHVPSIVATFHLSYDRLAAGDAGDDRARRLLHRAAWCAPVPIPRPLLVRLAAADPEAEPTDEAEETAAFALHRLAALGLIEPLPADGTARLHRLLAAYVRTRAPDPAGDAAAVEGALIEELYLLNEAGYPLAGVSYLDHAREAAARAAARGDADAATLLNNLGYLLKEQGNLGGRARCTSAPWRLMKPPTVPTIPKWRPTSTTWRGCCMHREPTQRRVRCTSAPWRSVSRRSAPPTPPPPPASTTWRSCCGRRGTWGRRVRCWSAPWRSASRRSAPPTPTPPKASTTWRGCWRIKVIMPLLNPSLSAPSLSTSKHSALPTLILLLALCG
jgi:hypothetical protein